MAKIAEIPAFFKTWWRVLVVVLVAFLFRVGYVTYTPGPGDSDLVTYINWAKLGLQRGLFPIYVHGWPDYPPVYVGISYLIGVIATVRGISFSDPAVTLMFKIVPIAADLLIVGIVAVWAHTKPVLRWLVPGLLAVSPGLIIVSTWRGQTDSLYMLFVILALILLSQDRPRPSWVLLAIAALTKPQGLLFGPLFLVLTYRRYGWRECARCVGLFLAVHIVVYLPFVLGNGLDNIIPVYIFHNIHPADLTFHALNFWFLVSPTYPFLPADTLAISGPLTARYVGDILFGTVTLLVLAHVWRNAEKRYEFVWAGILMLGFFIFFTGVYERYIYYAAVLLTIALLQEPRLWAVALGLTYTLALNNITLWTGPGYRYLGDWFGWFLWWEKFYWLAALANVAMLFETLRMLWKGTGLYYWFFQITRVAAICIAVALILAIIRDPLSDIPTANWLASHVATFDKIASEQLAVTLFAHDLHPISSTWDWRLTPAIDTQSLSNWRHAGIRYVVMDESANQNVDFNTRINDAVAQGGTLLYETPSVLNFTSRQAVLWTYRPHQQTDLIFDGSLRLLGYDLIHDKTRDSIILYWYAEQTPRINYHIYLHVFDPTTGAVLGISDTILGQALHSTATWQTHEMFSERYSLPVYSGNSVSRLEIGLYEFTTGDRAMLKDGNGHDQGDHMTILVDDNSDHPSDLFEF
ncbi:MAG TPA: hypothetical protein VKQ72_08145 [Aggregatilineales bacterium]|nr:hypothetical protein [Aggregatilineales bacterium]